MVLRKPYAFFIKMFKPIHIILAIEIAYLIYLQSKVFNFFNTYLYSSSSVIGNDLTKEVFNNFLTIIPIFVIVFSLIILGIMARKNKPSTFYIFVIFAYIIILIINLYCYNFLALLEKSIVAIKIVKLMHDLALINMIVQTFSFILFLIKGLGLDFKKFNFDSDLSKLNIDESDKEEFEINVNFDLSESNKKRKRKLRFLKYKYLENKFIINIGIMIFFFFIGVIAILIIMSYSRVNKEGKLYSVNGFNVMVDKTLLLNTNYYGKKITENYLVVVDCKMYSNYVNNKIYSDDFNLKIGEAIFKPMSKYSNDLLDIGNIYDKSILPIDQTNYIFIFEIPEKYITSDMVFSYSGKGESLSIKLNPKSFVELDNQVSGKIGESISFSDTLGNIEFKINDYEIKNSFLINYNYCFNDDCVASKEYLKPSIDTNFDKTILKVNVDYSNNTNLNATDFYDFFEKFGSIYYSINDNWKVQISSFEKITSKKSNQGKKIYIGVNSEIASASKIKLVFNIRGTKYEYLIKGDL